MKAGLVGLGVMGRNLALNLRDKGHEIVATDSWESARAWSAPDIKIAPDKAALVAALDHPRVVLLMVKAGEQVDNEIRDLLPHLEPGDMIIDGGNSNYHETERRSGELGARSIGYMGIGISGGAEGARYGAAIMAGGTDANWQHAKNLLVSFAASAGDGRPTLEYFGEGGAGHFVKMVHNGIEYAIMQAIAECHGLMRDVAGLSADAIADHFGRWSTSGGGAGFLLEISADIANAIDSETGELLLPLIDDVAGQKGTGGWTVEAASTYGVGASSIMEAVCARQLSGQKSARRAMQEALVGEAAPAPADVGNEFVEDLEAALVGSMVVAVSQGLQIYSAAADQHGWRGNLPDVLRVWRAGSILRMRMLDTLAAQMEAYPDAKDCLAVPEIARDVAKRLPAWRRAGSAALLSGFPAPVLTSTLSYAEGLATVQLPTAMVQAQRDRFGAHGFRRTDRPGDHHGPWSQPDESTA